MTRLAVIVVALALVGAGAFWLVTAPDRLTAADLPDHAPDVDNGRYVFFAGGCASCHMAPGEEDPTRLAGGLRLETPFGAFVVPNISPDPEHGMGGWSMLDFVNAMTRGVSPEGLHYYPAFPYTSYARMRLEDVIDLKAYLDTLPPIATSTPRHQIAFPFNVRRGLGLWQRLHLDPSPVVSLDGASAELARGAYLVEGPGHCGECHTPRDATGGLVRDKWMAGAPVADGDGFVPNITPHEGGIGAWSPSDVAYALESGFTPSFDVLGSTMAKVVKNTARLSAKDRAAIAAYLKALPALPTTPR